MRFIFDLGGWTDGQCSRNKGRNAICTIAKLLVAFRLKADLELCEDFLDVSETSLSYIEILFKRSTFEEWLRSVLKELRKRKTRSNLLDRRMLPDAKEKTFQIRTEVSKSTDRQMG